MRFLRGLLFAVAGLVVGAAAAVAVVTTCSAVHQQEWPRNGSPDWTGLVGLALLVLGPVAGGIAGLVIARRAGRGPR
jgi:hypothetical protein